MGASSSKNTQSRKFSNLLAFLCTDHLNSLIVNCRNMATLLHKHPHVPPTTFGEGAFPTCLSHMFSPRIKRQRRRQCAQQRQDAYHPTTLDTSRQLARLRAEEFTKSSPPLVNDPFAQHLVETMDVVRQNPLHPLSANTNNDENIDDEFGAAFDLAAARFVDDQVLLAASHVNTGREQGYNQVVLLGDAFCTRAFRLPWSPGTVIYLIAPAEGHERAEALLSSHTEMKARVPRGCLLRRVDCSITEETNSCAVALQRAGYRSDRLSVWALQVRLFFYFYFLFAYPLHAHTCCFAKIRSAVFQPRTVVSYYFLFVQFFQN